MRDMILGTIKIYCTISPLVWTEICCQNRECTLRMGYLLKKTSGIDKNLHKNFKSTLMTIVLRES